jgi:hypothetical protein
VRPKQSSSRRKRKKQGRWALLERLPIVLLNPPARLVDGA